MQTLITGGAGFIGSYLAEYLLKDNHQVTVIDNFSMSKREHLNCFEKRDNVKIVESDVTDLESIKPYFKNIDWVFHLSGQGGIARSVEEPLVYYDVNVNGTVNVLEASRFAGVKKFIYAASSSCYGVPDVFPTPECANIRPRHPYALTKYFGELCALHWWKVYKMPVISMRLFKVYGPRLPLSYEYGGMLGRFLAQKLSGKRFTVTGDGNQKRDFVYVADVIKAFIKAAEADVKGEIFNIGSGKPYSVNSLVKLLDGTVDYIPAEQGELSCTHADISKAGKLLGWEPETLLEEGIKKVLEWTSI